MVSRGCPHHCTFCYKDAFFAGGRSFYTQRVDAALAEIARLPGRHLYFLDDHLFANSRFARELFRGMRGMGRIFQGAATVDSILRDDVVEEAAAAGLRSLFVGFETLSQDGLAGAGKRQNLGRSYEAVVRRLDDLGIMINGSFVFGLDGDDRDVFRRTVDWAVRSGITTATFHILTPYPGTSVFADMAAQDRLVTRNWDLYDTRHVVYRPIGLSPDDLKRGYDWSYRAFYRWGSIFRAASAHRSAKHALKHAAYSAGWKKFERAWNFVIRIKQLSQMRPVLEAVLSSVARDSREHAPAGTPDASIERARSAARRCRDGSRIGLDGRGSPSRSTAAPLPGRGAEATSLSFPRSSKMTRDSFRFARHFPMQNVAKTRARTSSGGRLADEIRERGERVRAVRGGVLGGVAARERRARAWEAASRARTARSRCRNDASTSEDSSTATPDGDAVGQPAPKLLARVLREPAQRFGVRGDRAGGEDRPVDLVGDDDARLLPPRDLGLLGRREAVRGVVHVEDRVRSAPPRPARARRRATRRGRPSPAGPRCRRP